MNSEIEKGGEEMAWVSVHDSVDGSKLRELSKSIGGTKEEALGTLVSLWMWGLKNANEYGQIVEADKTDILDAFSAKLTMRYPNIVDILIAGGWIDCSEDDGILTLHDWEQWQSQWYKAVKKRDLDAKRQAKRRRELKESKSTVPCKVQPDPRFDGPHSETVENISFLPEEAPKPMPVKPASKYSVGFEEFWKVYPRKVDKGNAYKKYAARRNDGFSDEELLQAATAYARECVRLHTESAYIKHPKTFLSDSLPFTDYLPEKKGQPQESILPSTENPFDDWGMSGNE